MNRARQLVIAAFVIIGGAGYGVWYYILPGQPQQRHPGDTSGESDKVAQSPVSKQSMSAQKAAGTPGRLEAHGQGAIGQVAGGDPDAALLGVRGLALLETVQKNCASPRFVDDFSIGLREGFRKLRALDVEYQAGHMTYDQVHQQETQLARVLYKKTCSDLALLDATADNCFKSFPWCSGGRLVE